ncbi:CaiB/BaiF CoA transferase family protein [Methylobacterium trifolii]|uniref:Succinyl-CoA--L-malate CoA-transferase beta subunit n=1 Tax=Methylobacterium trifolii TaxID=1003092 RepID=A0ABQ4TYM9_9HYPH|nr:CoA transferase [Methylobacterium trifolii]GJE60370.1 Succinyl-CoA--L-malate CoA-transferase beta subunit [Methylobacterium trifolii]
MSRTDPGTPPRPYAQGASAPLDDVRVVDLSRLVAGNMLSLMLADFGAEVVKVEQRKRGDTLRDWKDGGHPLYWKVYARNKKSITLDYKKPAGKEVLMRLAAQADVLIESFRPGVMERLGLGPEELHAVNPRLVYVRVSGWGQTGPYRNRPGFGSLVEAMSGFASKTGFADKPPILPNMALADMVAGLQGAYAVMVALRAAAAGGAGQVVDVSLLEPLFSTLGPDVAIARVTGRAPSRVGNRTSISSPRNIYPTKDGAWVALSASTQGMCERLFRAIGRPDMIEDPRFRSNSDRLDNADQVDAVVGAFIQAMDLDAAIRFFEAAEVTVGPVYDAAQIVHDPHVIGREVVVEMEDRDLGALPMHAVSPRLSGTPGVIRSPAPDLGQHLDEILERIGYDAAARRRLAEEDVT